MALREETQWELCFLVGLRKQKLLLGKTEPAGQVRQGAIKRGGRQRDPFESWLHINLCTQKSKLLSS